MRAVPGRIVCARCGENNFNTQANCWKCGSSLAGTPPVRTPPPRAASPPAAYAAASSAPAPALVSRPVDPAVALWAAIALALFFPGVAVPVGLVFLMLDDRRKVEIGRITLIWGLVFTLLHLLATAWLMRGLYEEVRLWLRPGAAATATAPKPTDSVPPIHIPGEQSDAPDVPFPEPPTRR
jgi:hypothetical protein